MLRYHIERYFRVRCSLKKTEAKIEAAKTEGASCGLEPPEPPRMENNAKVEAAPAHFPQGADFIVLMSVIKERRKRDGQFRRLFLQSQEYCHFRYKPFERAFLAPSTLLY